MTFQRTFDLDLVRSIITNPRLFRWAVDDYAPSAEEFRPNDSELIWYVLAHEGGELLGLLIFLPQSAVLWEIHVSLLPNAWGRAAQACSEAFAWVFDNTSAQRIVAHVPGDNRLALRLSKRAGMTQYGLNPASFQRDGKLHDLILMGISK